MSNSGLHVHVSNRLEILVKKLANEVQKPLAAPLEPDRIIVQSQGMARWVSMQLAEQNRICANVDFPFPNAFLSFLCRKLLPDIREDRLFESDAMVFRIMTILPQRIHKPEYGDLQTYLADDPQDIKKFQLASKIADLFDQYLIFRTDMVRDWEQGSEPPDITQKWQADLWHAVKTSKECIHRGEMQKRLLETLMLDDVDLARLPARILAFGISHLPRFHTEILAAISQHVPVHLFLMNPCREYWGEIVSSRDVRRIRTHYEDKAGASEDLHLDKGNRILSSMGTLGRDFLSMVSELDCIQSENFTRPDGRTMLSQVQADILDLYEPSNTPGARHVSDTKTEPNRSDSQCDRVNDRSISVHACHSPMREVEILYDQILGMLQADTSLQPRDILVMMPDIETYTPYISAVFGTVDDDRMRIPYSIADRNALNLSPVFAGFLAVLELNSSRMEAGRILDILSYDAIRDQFGIAESDLDLVETWVGELNIRWGIDRQAISKLELPAGGENTWLSGMDRLLLGLAMSGNNHQLYAGILPYDNLEGMDALVLGKFLEFIACLFSVCEALDRPQRISQWYMTLTDLVERMFTRNDAYARDLQMLQKILDSLVADANVAGFNENLDLVVILSYLRTVLEREKGTSGFILGGVTFCAMLPMRSIPFKVICLLGMNSDAFPRDSKTVSFDLIASYPRLGDRSRREDDKYLFIEALISAREKLYISYLGQSIQDNTRLVPCMPVSELLDYLQDRFSLAAIDLIQYHPLQAFSRTYFLEDSHFFSYSRENFEAVSRVKSLDPMPAERRAQISPPADDWRQVELPSLCQFFKNPTRFLLQKRLGISLEEQAPLPDDTENFRMKHLDEYRLAQDLLDAYVKGRQPEALFPAVQARGILPHGAIGQFDFKRMCGTIRRFALRLKEFTHDLHPVEMPIELEVGCFSLTGKIPELYGDACVHARYTRFNPGDLICTWIYHLIQSRMSPESLHTSWYVSRDTTVELRPIQDSESILLALLNTYWAGLSESIHFFPVVAYNYARQVVQHHVDPDKAMQVVANQWANDFGWSEADDPYIAHCFRDRDPLDDEFRKLATSVFGPILKNHRELKGP